MKPISKKDKLFTCFNKQLQKTDLQENLANLAYVAKAENLKVAFSTSFGAEDQVLLAAIQGIPEHGFKIFTLDTGRLFSETYALWARTQKRYSVQIEAYFPDATALEKYVNTQGINAFYESVALRKTCCHIRKVEPLRRALTDVDVWITGLRAEQSANRQSVELLEWDESYQLLKYQPLLHFTNQMLWGYVQQNNVSYNTLHDKGFVSIGCAPCTRAIREGEDFRAGRWWWEDHSKKECGLHSKN